jgi:hypothetical protein
MNESANTQIRLQEIVPGSFIFEMRAALSSSACADMVSRFEAATDEQYVGRIGQGASLDTSVKQSTDLVLSGKPHWEDVDRRLFRSLGHAMQVIARRHTFFSGRFSDVGYAIQRTDVGGYYHWHVDGGSHEFADRQLVAIWYLNDVPGPGGATEFRAQDVSIQPEAGKLLLFPPFWTHEHRGAVLTSGVKYIATTWVSFA